MMTLILFGLIPFEDKPTQIVPPHPQIWVCHLVELNHYGSKKSTSKQWILYNRKGQLAYAQMWSDHDYSPRLGLLILREVGGTKYIHIYYRESTKTRTSYDVEARERHNAWPPTHRPKLFGMK